MKIRIEESKGEGFQGKWSLWLDDLCWNQRFENRDAAMAGLNQLILEAEEASQDHYRAYQDSLEEQQDLEDAKEDFLGKQMAVNALQMKWDDIASDIFEAERVGQGTRDSFTGREVAGIVGDFIDDSDIPRWYRWTRLEQEELLRKAFPDSEIFGL